MSTDIAPFIATMPKVELHVHIEGCVEPDLLLELADRNGVDLGYRDVDEVLAAQDYPDPALPHFLEYHYRCVRVLRRPEDFHEVVRRFLATCARDRVRHVEIMFGPMAHTDRGIRFDPMFEAMAAAGRDAERELDLTVEWIMCIDREHTLAEAMDMLAAAEAHRESIIGLGLASYEEGNPPVKFLDAYRAAAAQGYRLTAHCDCDQRDSTEHIRQCLHELGVERIDHGLHVLDDPALLAEVRDRRIALTMCPTWRPRDPEPRRLAGIRTMLDEGLLVSLNTDDPSEFASHHLAHMLHHVQARGGFTDGEMLAFMRNAVDSAWVDDARRAELHTELTAHAAAGDGGVDGG